MDAIPPDYDSDPDRWAAWKPPADVHEIVAAEIQGPVLDVGGGDGRLADLLGGEAWCVGCDTSSRQLAANRNGPLVQADMRALPFRDGAFAAVAHLWCLYEVDDPRAAIAEAARVLRTDGTYYASTAARTSDPELVPEHYPMTPFDAEEAATIVASSFGRVEPQYWDGRMYPLLTRAEVLAFCRHHRIAEDRAEGIETPLWLTKRGVLIRASKRTSASSRATIVDREMDGSKGRGGP